jgi:hypothetical protein
MFKRALGDVRVSAFCCWVRRAVQQASRKEIIEGGWDGVVVAVKVEVAA